MNPNSRIKYRKAVYAGSFDPITNGHLWMIREGSCLFDSLLVAVGVNRDKRCSFSLDERLEMLDSTIGHLASVTIGSFSNKFLVHYAKEVGAEYILRGIRNVNDYSYERAIRLINSDLALEISTVFLMPPREISEISSSLIKELIGPSGWEDIVKNYVPEPVFAALKKKYFNSNG
jgi:pantetheine-phosphate adenylyltransferase